MVIDSVGKLRARDGLLREGLATHSERHIAVLQYGREAEALLKIIDDCDCAKSISCPALELRDRLNFTSIGACSEELLKQ